MTITDLAMPTRVDTDWRHNAACTAQDPELFYPVGDSGPARVQAAYAKSVCRTCPSQQPCLDWAIDRGEQGVWGNTTEDERRVIALNRHTAGQR